MAVQSKAMHGVREEYLDWLLLDKRAKRVHHLPLTAEEFAEVKGTTSRTLRRWQSEPEFQDLLEQRRVAQADRMMPNSAVTPRAATDQRIKRRLAGDKDKVTDDTPDPFDDPTAPASEREFLRIKGVLATMAAEGDRQALELWMKYWGKAFVDAESGREGALAELSDDELLGEACRLVGPEFASWWLAGLAATR